MFGQVILALVAILVGYKAIKPPPPKKCGSPGGPSITSSRIKLKDGRYLAYREAGVSKEEAKYKVLVVHFFDSSKDVTLPVSQELVEELKIYFLFYDRAGYGESDPYPRRSVKSEAFDIQQLADALHLGSKFYVIGISMGGNTCWSCLKYIPQRLAGVSLVVPFINHMWPCFPPDLSRAASKKLAVQDVRTFLVARYAPWLFYWWMTQKWFPSLSITSGANSSIFSRKDLDDSPIFSWRDLEILQNLSKVPSVGQNKIRQQGEYESLHRDIMVGYGKWEFDILEISNPFPDNHGSVHMWQGYEDKLNPFELGRFISKKLPWIKYHEVPDGGHLMFFDQRIFESILRALLLG